MAPRGRMPFPTSSITGSCSWGGSGYSPDFEEVGERFGPFDLAAIPIGHYAPRWYVHAMHIDPAEAVLVHRDVRARCSVAIHWGTFPLPGDEPLDEPPKRLRVALLQAGISPGDFAVMQHGETRHLHTNTCESQPGIFAIRTDDSQVSNDRDSVPNRPRSPAWQTIASNQGRKTCPLTGDSMDVEFGLSSTNPTSRCLAAHWDGLTTARANGGNHERVD
jgi:hypothetical protein